MFDTGIVPVFYHYNIEIAKQAVKACYVGGIRVFEFTNRGDYAHEMFDELNKWVAIECLEMIMAIGSIVDASTASLYLQLGANFVVSPLINPEIFKICNRRQIPYLPSCESVSKIGLAQEMRAKIVKMFPGKSIGGPSFVKSLMRPRPWSRIMITGGVEPTEENLSAWFKAGVSCVGIGSNFFPKEFFENNELSKVIELCKSSLKIVQAYVVS